MELSSINEVSLVFRFPLIARMAQYGMTYYFNSWENSLEWIELSSTNVVDSA